MTVAAVQGVYSLRRISEPFRINIEYMWLLKKQPASDYMTMFGRFFYDSWWKKRPFVYPSCVSGALT